MKSKKLIIIAVLLIVSAFTLAACGGGNRGTDAEGNEENRENTNEESTSHSQGNMSEHMSSSGEVPAGMQEAENPKYEVGSTAIINVQHMNMEGMSGAEATITGAYDTTAYTVSYTLTTGGEPVEDHKWVIHEELLVEDPGDDPLEPGTEVTLNTDHMKGMNGATATIDSAEDTTVYMVDFTPTTGGVKVVDHKWVVESELESAE
ncbi:YdhK family protein [Virgibacillus sp. NKC19-16]|uniref:YdhK family protein n=1 Tax=Virgibacillus salidurans TaxID=2831673 RepID=UPI001F35523D|nr:YdhK family protein [Virgibacillus sp. NKC19-16]UJL46653.1 YdhK family protein [Virgibacillus sp. NKC19-16]